MDSSDPQFSSDVPSAETRFLRITPTWLCHAAMVAVLLTILFVVGRQNYLLFHSLTELASIAVAWSVFLLVWNSRKFVDNDALVLLGIAYLFVGLFDLVHTLAYKGMGVFPSEQASNLATQLWISARSLESSSLLAFSLLLGRRLRVHVVLWAYAGVAALLLSAIFAWHLFPVCYIEGEGLTVFKRLAEYVICLVLGSAAVLLYYRREFFDSVVFRLILASLLTSIGAELAFTFYVGVYDLSNLMGHYFKLISFFLVYAALIRTGLAKPYTLLFRELGRKEAELRESERRWRTLAEGSPDYIVALDIDLNITFANRAPPDREIEQLIGTSVLTHVDEDRWSETEAILQSVLKTCQPAHYDATRHATDGTVTHYETHVVPQVWGPEVTGLVLVARDITERKRRENVLAAHCRLSELAATSSVEELLKEFLTEAETLTGSKIGFYHFVEDDQVTLSLQAWSTNTLDNMCMAEGNGQHYSIHEAGVWVDCVRQRRPVIHNDYASLPHRKGMPEGHAPVTRELVVPVLRAGKIVAILGVGNKESDYGPEDTEIVSTLAETAWEIVQRKRTEQDLAESERYFRSLMHSMHEDIVVLDRNHRITDINNSASVTTGLTRDEMIGRSCYEVLHGHQEPCDRRGAPCGLAEVFATGQPSNCHHQHMASDGSTVNIDILLSPLRDSQGNVTHVIEAMRDVSDLFETQRALERSQVALARAQEVAHLGNWEWDLVQNRGRWSDEMFRIHGLPMDADLTMDVVRGLVHDDDKEILDRAMSDGGSEHPESIEYRIVRPDGVERFVHTMSTLVFDDSGNVVGIFGTVQDITERKVAEESLRESEERFRTLVEQSPSAIEIYEPDGRMSLVNDAWSRFWNLKREDVADFNILEDQQCEATGLTSAFREAQQGRSREIPEILFDPDQSNFTGGRVRWISARMYPIISRTGEIASIVLTYDDITERKQAERESREVNARLTAWMDNTPAVVFTKDSDGRFVYMNHAFETLFGTTLDEAFGRTMDEFYPIPVEFSQQLLENDRRVLAENRPMTLDEVVVIDGQHHDFITVKFPLPGLAGHSDWVAGIATDITDRKHAERALRESEAVVRGLLDATPESFFMLDMAGTVLVTNETAARRLNMPVSKLVGTCVHDLMPPQLRESRWARVEEVVRSGIPMEFEDARNGAIYHNRVCPMGNADGQTEAVAVFAQDITERKRVEESQQFEHTRMMSILEAIPDGVYVVSQQCDIEYINPVLEKEFGPVDGRKCHEYFHGLKQVCPWCKNDEIFAGKSVQWEWYSTKNARHYDLFDMPFRNTDGSVSKLEIFRDITERKQAEEAIKREAARWRSISENSPDHIMLLDRDANILFINRTVPDLTVEQVIGRPVGEFVPLESRPAMDACFEQVLETGKPGRYLTDYKTREGDVRFFATRVGPVMQSDQIIGLVTSSTDITEVKQAEQKMLTAERMQAEAERLAVTGRLAARVAHEINNPLAGIKNSFLLIKDAVPADHPDHDMVERIEKEIDRIAGIVRQMYTLHSPQADTPTDQSLNETLRDVLVMLDPLQREHAVGIRLDLAPNEITLWVPKGNFHQVLYNLLANAVEASVPGSMVVIDAWHDDNEEDAVIEIRDQGGGIPADVQDQIFEPFFSTKDDGNSNVGMGLGLSIVKSIAETAGGAIEFESEVGRGTTFRVRLPVSRKAQDG